MERLGFRDVAAIHMAAALTGTRLDLTPRELAEKAFDLATALADERARRELDEDGPRPPRAPPPEAASRWQPPARRPRETGSRADGHP
jgi:hypothetical protein